MAYIQPNSTIEFFGDLNLSDNYDDTLYFPTVEAKDAYFTAIPKLATAPTCSYTRENRGFVRVEIPMSTLIGANYMRFKNTSFENKWWYAFVKKVDYVNNLTTEVEFEIDTIMSWMGTFTLNECYIERQHTLRDGIGNNICDEGLPTGEYVIEDREVWSLGVKRIVMVYLENTNIVDGDWNANIYNGYKVAVFNNPSTINSVLTNLVEMNLIDNVIAIYMSYSDITNSSDGQGGREISVSKPYNSLNGYVPRNKKLFCYPYKYFLLDNSEGDSKEYMYEFFGTLPDQTSSGNATFMMHWIYSGSCEVFCAPTFYKGLNDDVGRELYQEGISMTHFPMCAWGTNTYEAYLAQKNAYLVQNMLKSGVAGAVSGTKLGVLSKGGIGVTAGAAVAGAGIGVLEEVSNNLIENTVKPTTPMQQRGTQNLDMMFSLANKHFTGFKMCITKNYAMMLDSYFDMFGYAVKQHGVPNMNARPNWTFVKTIGCSVGGNIPADDASKIEDIFNRGVRFWKNHNNIGNYSLNNAPV